MPSDATYLDLHVHSTDGSDDAGGSVEAYLKWVAARRKLGLRIDGFVVTEHRNYDPDRDYSDLATKYDAIVLRGVEVETTIGHVLVFGVTPAFLAKFDLSSVSLPYEDVFRVAWETGGVAVGAHAGRPRIGCVEHVDERGVTLEGVRIIEALNGGSNDYENGRSFDLAEARGLRVVGASDTHFVSALGRCLTRFDRDIRTIEDLVATLRDPDASYMPMYLDDTKDGVEPRPRPSGAAVNITALAGSGSLDGDAIEYDRSVIGREVPVGKFEVTRELINEYCDALDQRNPLYTDEEFAKHSVHKGLIAPPGIVQAVRMDGPPDPKVTFGDSTIMAGTRHEYLLPVRPGDTIEGFAQVKEVYEKTGRSGRMVFVVRRTRYANQHGEDVAAVEATSAHREVKAVGESSMTNQTMTQRYFDDINVGDSFEETKEPTTEQVVAFVRANGLPDGGGRFTDAEKAKALGLVKPIVPGPMSASMLTRVVTDWMGPLGRIISIDVSFRRPVQHHDILRCVALVTDVNGEGDFEGTGSGAVHLDVTLENDRGEKPVQGTAVVELPRRA